MADGPVEGWLGSPTWSRTCKTAPVPARAAQCTGARPRASGMAGSAPFVSSASTLATSCAITASCHAHSLPPVPAPAPQPLHQHGAHRLRSRIAIKRACAHLLVREPRDSRLWHCGYQRNLSTQSITSRGNTNRGACFWTPVPNGGGDVAQPPWTPLLPRMQQAAASDHDAAKVRLLRNGKSVLPLKLPFFSAQRAG